MTTETAHETAHLAAFIGRDCITYIHGSSDLAPEAARIAARHALRAVAIDRTEALAAVAPLLAEEAEIQEANARFIASLHRARTTR